MIFEYTTIDAGGNEVKETIEADDQSAAEAELRAREKIILSLKEASLAVEGESESYEFSCLDYLSFVRIGDIAIFFRQLSSLLNSGVTLVNALYVLEEQEKKIRLKKMIGRMRLDIQGGSSFLKAMERYPNIFDSRVCGMLDAGEASGTIGEMLERIATHLEEDAGFRNQVITGAIYPAIVIIVVFVVIAFLVGFVIPRITPLLTLKAQKLPWNTQLIIDVSDWFMVYWMYFFAAIGITGSLIFLSYRSIAYARYWVDRLKLKLPVVGPVFYYSVVVQFTRNLSTLIGSGVSVMESIRIVRDIISNTAAKKVLETMETHILRGENLSSPIKAANFIFPPMVASMVSVGEETGSVDISLGIAADIHEKILKTYIQRMTAMIEPLLIVFLGGIVGFVALALISGILTMYQV
ncbi:MAG: type II secretion system F family protein [Thermodesulfobacteriota bacterium]|nr:type II secretion system F family protein [Thermodesulfobacteriota bacterium]